MSLRPRLKRILIITLTTLVGVYLLLAGALFFVQRSLLYPAPGLRQPRPPGGQVLELPGPTFVTWVPPSSPGARTVVFFHGNGEQLASCDEWALLFGERGLGFMAVEYPGYGLMADQPPSESALYAAAETALLHLREKLSVKDEDVVLYGHSLGSGVAVEMAARGFGRRLMLVSPYTSITDVAKTGFGLLPVDLLVLDRFDSEKKTSKLSMPAIVFHGERDALIPVGQGKRMAEALKGEFVVVPGASHNDVFDRKPGRDVPGRLVEFAAAKSLQGR